MLCYAASSLMTASFESVVWVHQLERYQCCEDLLAGGWSAVELDCTLYSLGPKLVIFGTTTDIYANHSLHQTDRPSGSPRIERLGQRGRNTVFTLDHTVYLWFRPLSDKAQACWSTDRQGMALDPGSLTSDLVASHGSGVFRGSCKAREDSLHGARAVCSFLGAETFPYGRRAAE